MQNLLGFTTLPALLRMPNDASLAPVLVPHPHRDAHWEPEPQAKAQGQASVPRVQGDREDVFVGQ